MADNQTFSPINPVYLLTSDSIKELPTSNISVNEIGQKAFGLSCLPSEWVPPYCVISQSVASTVISKPEILHQLKNLTWYQELLSTSEVIIRSSAVHETIEERGQLISEITSVNNLHQTLIKCIEQTKLSEQTVHWILQPKIKQKSMGHLSNERRVAKVKRDWLLEFELTDGLPNYRVPVSIGIRNWREGEFTTPEKLICDSSIRIDSSLRAPAKWAASKKLRVHYEWVWDGDQIWIVQADFCGPVKGVDPKSFLPKHVKKIDSTSLKIFRFSTKADFENYRKLANSNLYSELGYKPPNFFILDNQQVISDLINGCPSVSVVEDIAILVSQRALVIRTDGISQQMLPRSDGLSSVESTLNWFKNELPIKLRSIENWKDNIIFICHHYLPALASAWSRAEPGKRVVRIEALWGIPEGMYWYGHDAFEVDTTDIDLSKAMSNIKSFKHFEKIRYKELFIAPDSEEVWCSHKASEPYDWKATISDKNWLSEIALTTRKIAKELNQSVNVMWFLGIHPDAAEHEILPWFHEKSELNTNSLRVAPRFKDPNTKGIKIRTLADWNKLLGSHQAYKESIKRISVSPREPNLIRNEAFLSELASFAKSQSAVIELMGGILSHVFYMLQKDGCIVEIIDPFGTNEESLVFKKLVRDKMPESIEKRGEIVTHLKINGDQLVRALKTKLLEEAIEVFDTQSSSDTQEELADVLEVIHAISKHLNISMKSIEETRKQKRDKRGGFDQGVVLVKTSAPASFSTEKPSSEETQRLFTEGAIIESGAVTLESDVKLHQDDPEIQGIKQRLLEIEFTAIPEGQIRRSTEFKIMAKLEKEAFEIPMTGEWIISRKKSELKVRLLITPRPTQFKLPFE